MERNRRFALVLVCVAQFMVILDISVVNVALPAIRHAFDFSESGLQWIVNAYTLAFAGFLLLGGRAADLLGRRRVLMGGLVLLGLASLAGGLAQNGAMLIAARAAQGLGGAIVAPATLAIITTTFTEGAERNRALGAWGAVGAAGGSFGSVVGGLLADADWRWVLFVNVPIVAAVVALAPRILSEGRNERQPRYFDIAGALTVTLGLVALVYAIVRTEVAGWTAPETLGVGGAGLALLALFVAIEGRFARAPLVPLRLLRTRQTAGANAVIFALGAGAFAMWFFVSLYFQEVLGYSALEAGAAFLPMTVTIAVSATLASRLVTRFGPRPLLVAGMGSLGVGLLLLTRLPTHADYWADVFGPSILPAIGIGLSFVPTTIAAVSGVARNEAGLVSGILNTSRQVGGALGLAILATVAATRTGHLRGAGETAAAAFTGGFERAFAVGAGFALVGALLAALLLRPAGDADATEAEPAAV